MHAIVAGLEDLKQQIGFLHQHIAGFDGPFNSPEIVPMLFISHKHLPPPEPKLARIYYFSMTFWKQI